jgi:hypothetical protein
MSPTWEVLVPSIATPHASKAFTAFNEWRPMTVETHCASNLLTESAAIGDEEYDLPPGLASPDVLNAFIGGFNCRNAEIKRLHDKIIALDQVQSDVIAENAALASALEASKSEVSKSMVAASLTIPTPLGPPDQTAPTDLEDFIGGIDSRGSGTRGLREQFIDFEATESDLIVEGIALAKRSKASKQKRNFAMILIALGGCVAGFGSHLLGSQIYSRETGIAITAIGSGLGLMNLGWLFRPRAQ